MFRSELDKHTAPVSTALLPVLAQIKELEEIVAASDESFDETDPDAVEALVNRYDACMYQLREVLGMSGYPHHYNQWFLNDALSTPIRNVEGFQAWSRSWIKATRRKIAEAEAARVAAIQAEKDRIEAERLATEAYEQETLIWKRRLGLPVESSSR